MINRNKRNRKIRKQKKNLLVKFSTFAISLMLVVGLVGAVAFAKDKIEDGTLTLPSAGISALLEEVAETADGDTISDIQKAVEVEKTTRVALLEEDAEEYSEETYEEEYFEDEYYEEDYTDEEYIEDEYYEDEYIEDEYIEEEVVDNAFLGEESEEVYEEQEEEPVYEEETEEVYEEEVPVIEEQPEEVYDALEPVDEEVYYDPEPFIEETTANDVQPAPTVSANSSVRQAVADLAASLVGVTQYVSAGRSLYATDCSGFAYMLYSQFGLYASPASDAYMAPYDFGYFISESELQPGDIVVYRYGGHVAIYEGNGQIVHCAGEEWGTCWASMYYDTPSAFVRINGS